MKSLHVGNAVLALAVALLLRTSLGANDTIHVERFLAGGKSFNSLYLPAIHQMNSGLTVTTVIDQQPGPTFFDQWVVRTIETPYPAIAVAYYRNYLSAGAFLSSEFPYAEATLLSTGRSHVFDEGPLFEELMPFDYERNGGWVRSHTLGWIFIRHHPWIFQPELGWLFLLRAEPAEHAMAFYGYTVSGGWTYFGEGFRGWVWEFDQSAWRTIEVPRY